METAIARDVELLETGQDTFRISRRLLGRKEVVGVVELRSGRLEALVAMRKAGHVRVRTSRGRSNQEPA